MTQPKPPADDTPRDDRRARLALRSLIDEMLMQLRAAANSDTALWTAETRARAEADLERIMSSVRQEALSDQPAQRGRD